MTSKFTELAIDCADPQAADPLLVLGPRLRGARRRRGYRHDRLASAGRRKNRPGPVAPTLIFAHVPEAKAVKNRFHQGRPEVVVDAAGEGQVLPLGRPPGVPFRHA